MVHKHRIKWLVIVSIIILSLALGGCGSTASTQEKVIKIGASMPLTGGLSKEGNLLKQGYEFWEQYVNEKGGIKVGNDKYQVKIIMYDDGSNAQTASKLTEKLISEDKVNFLLSPYSSGLVQATSSIAEKYHIINIAPIANAESLYERGYKYIFGILPKAASNLSSIVDMIGEYKLDIKSLVVVSPDDLFPLNGAEGVKSSAEKMGLKVDFIKYPKDSSDLSSVVSQIKAINPDAVISSAYFEGAVLLVKQMKEQKVSPKLLGFQDAPGMPDFVKTLGKDAEGIIGTAWWTPNTGWKDESFGSSEDFAKMYKEKTKTEEITYHPAAAVAGGEVLAAAIEKAGTLETEAVRKALLDLNLETFFMPVKFGETGKASQINIAASAIPMQIQNGKPVVIYPQKIKQAQIIFPLKPWETR